MRLMYGLALCGLVGFQPRAHGSSLDMLYQFQGGADGQGPAGGLLHLNDGSFVGTTLGGGLYNRGTVFTLTPPTGESAAWTKQTVYSFSPADGEQPGGGLVADQAGRIYGTTSTGGSYGAGTVFRLDPTSKWAETTLWNFGSAVDGRTPLPALVISGSGAVYGISSGGGAYGFGTVFEISQSMSGKSAEGVLWSFTGGLDGKYPSSLTQDQYGTLYGSVSQGGAFASGAIFKLDPTSGPASPSILWAFHGTADGAYPTSLISNHLGGFYTTLAVGPGYSPNGSVAKLSDSGGKWLLTSLLTLAGGTSGAIPNALTVLNSGTLAGISLLGGANACEAGHIPVACGTAYLLHLHGNGDPATKEEVLWDFAPPPFPSSPSSAFLGLGRNTYIGETQYGGAAGAGTVVSIVE